MNHVAHDTTNAFPPLDVSLPAAAARLKQTTRCALVTHANADGDAIGSLVALMEALANSGVDVEGFVEMPVPPEVTAMHGLDRLRHIDDFAPDGRDVIFVDCATPDRTAANWLDRLDGTWVLNVDHHPTNSRFGAVNVVDPTATASAELIQKLLETMDAEITPPIAESLFIGLATDCGFFSYGNTRPETLRLGAFLLEQGADIGQVYKKAVQTRSYAQMRLIGAVLADMRNAADGRIVYAVIPQRLYEETGATHRDAEGIVEMLRTLRGVDTTALLRETPSGVRVSLRSERTDVRGVAQSFGGGGHIFAAGCTIEGNDLEAAARQVVVALQDALPPA